jgi:choline dehydrogenase-like flavoprotein
MSGEPPNSADVVIIGSGAGGGTLAYALRDLGARVVLLERGEILPHEPENWQPSAVFVDQRYKTRELWQDDKGTSFRPGVHYAVGGNTKVYGSALPRFRRSDFQATEHADGISPRWPFDYADLEPYYAEAERIYSVHGRGGDDVTDPPRSGPFPFPPVDHEPTIANLAERLTRAGYSPSYIPLGIDLRENGRCIRCATCDGFPCLLDAKADAEVSCVRPAVAAGVLLVTGATVRRVLTDRAGEVATGVEYERRGNVKRIDAGIVVVCAGAVNSAALLLRSTSSTHPNGLGNSSDLIGRNYMAHNNTVMTALSPHRNTVRFQKTLYVNDFYESGNDRHAYPLGHIQLVGKIQAEMLRSHAPFVPMPALRAVAAHSVDWWLFTEDLPTAENRIRIVDGKITLSWTPNNVAAHRQLVRETRRMLRRAGYHIALTKRMGIDVNSHQAGTARAGHDLSTSVLDRWCRSHDVPNLFVVDSSFFPSLPVTNPALTIAANSLRVADRIRIALGAAHTRDEKAMHS